MDLHFASTAGESGSAVTKGEAMYGGTVKASDLENSNGKPSEQIRAPEKAHVGELAQEASRCRKSVDSPGNIRTPDLTPSRFFVVGPAGAGKSEFAKALAAELSDGRREPVVVGECGEVLIQLLARQLCLGPHKLANDHNSLEDWIANIRQWKALYRAQLRELGEQLAAANPGYVPYSAMYGIGSWEKAETYTAATKVVAGIRRASEYGFIMDVADVWIYVDRAGAGVASDSFDAEYFRSVCPVKVQNDGDLAALRVKAKAFVETL